MSAQTTVNENSQIQIIDRVSNLPLVKSALGYANDRYGKIKEINPLVSATLTFNEQALSYLLTSAAYILEKQLPLADSLACQGLDRLEEKVPAIKQSPEEIYTSSVQKYNDIKSYGTNRVESLKKMGYQKVQDALGNQYAQALIKTVDSAVDLTDNAFDRFVPPTEDEEQEPISAQDANLIRKMSNLSDKMRRRLSKNASIQIENFHKQSQEALQHIIHSVDLIQYAKNLEEAGRQRLTERIASIQDQARHLWEELKNDKEETEGQVKTFEHQLLVLARRATKLAIDRYNNLNEVTKHLPENVLDAVKMCSDYAKDVNTQLSQVSNIKELTDLALRQISSGALLLQNGLNKALSPIFPTLSWITPKDNEQDNSKKEETTVAPSEKPSEPSPKNTPSSETFPKRVSPRRPPAVTPAQDEQSSD